MNPSPASAISLISLPMATFLSKIHDATANLGKTLSRSPNSSSSSVPEHLLKLYKEIESSSQLYGLIADYQENNEDKEIQHIQFSKLKKRHIDDIGLTVQSVPTWDFVMKLEKFFVSNSPNSRTQSTVSDLFEPFWEANSPQFIVHINYILEFFSRSTETRARILTDSILIQVGIILKKKFRSWPLIFLELVLATMDRPVIIPRNDKITLLTGKADYALLSLLQPDQCELGLSESAINVLLEQTSLDMLVDAIPNAICLSQDLLAATLMEEKSEENGGRSLCDSRPQAYGECVAILDKTGRHYVPWCLNNGVEWLFGIVEDVSGQLHCYEISEAVVLNQNLDSLKCILKFLLAWMGVPAIDLAALLMPGAA